MAVYIEGTGESGLSLSNAMFSALRDEVDMGDCNAELHQLMESAELTYLLELEPLTAEQRLDIAQGVARLRDRAAERQSATELLEHLTRVREFILTQGVNL